jgi:hypothetical protein
VQQGDDLVRAKRWLAAWPRMPGPGVGERVDAVVGEQDDQPVVVPGVYLVSIPPAV